MSRYVLRDGIAVVAALNPPVNGLSLAVRQGLLAGLRQAKADSAKAVIIVGDGATFPAGADITEFASGGWRDAPDLAEVVKELDAAEVPVVAAIHGNALGGGLETALACHYRVALPSAKLGLPEVHLGILPGAGGTQRLPRLVDVSTAIDLISSGRPVSAAKAGEMGLVDSVIQGETADDLLDGAIDFVKSVVLGAPGELPRVSARTVAPVDPSVYAEAQDMLAKKARGQLAPQLIVEAVRAAEQAATFDEGMREETALFEQLMSGTQAKAMQHMFFAERQCSKVPNVDGKLARDVRSVGVIGAGTMGRGIAMCFVNRGIPVTLAETNEEALQGGIDAIEALYKRSSAFRSGKLTESGLAERMALIQGTVESDFAPLANCDAVIEAVFESEELKKDIFARLGKVCKDEALLCTNTSYLDIDRIGAASQRPENFLGTHFFSPANVMPLLENVRGAKTSEAAIATAMKMGKTIGKTTVLAGNCYGFIGNRMFEAYTQQAICLLEEGASPAQVDRALYDFGMALGPLAVCDLAGNDISYRIRREPYYPHKAEQVQGRRGATWMALADALCDMGRLGQKTGAGWFRYEGRTPVEDSVVAELCEKHRAEHGIERRDDISDYEILERCLYPLINEGYRIVDEGIASRASDVDVVWNAGYGFPRYRGGPLFYAETLGRDKVVEGLRRLHGENPDLQAWQFEPCELLLSKAAEDAAAQAQGW